MTGKPKYDSEEERRAARQRTIAKYNASQKRLETAKRYGATEKARAALQRYRQGPKYAARRADYASEQFHAWTAIRYATHSGKIARPDECEQCGVRKRIEAHHHKGYAREHWLDVQWLCGDCHIEAHARNSRH